MTNKCTPGGPLLATETFDRLAELSSALDLDGHWPVEQWPPIEAAGVLRWIIPREFGGLDLSPAELLSGYIRLASACLTTTFILTQRNGACQRIAGSSNEGLKREWMPALAHSECFATVGISHLTTSRQHWRQPAVAAAAVAGGFRLSGTVPWVTGAAHADAIVTGGTLADGRQLLALVRTADPAVEAGPPARLLALSASCTSPVSLNDVFVPEADIVAGPVEKVMSQGVGGGAGSLATSALALGLSLRACRGLGEEAAMRPDLEPILATLSAECTALESALLDASGGSATTASDLRARANSLALRSTQAYLAASKGAGFVSGHLAERIVREAMFFLVWSCPQPVVQTHLRELAGLSTC